MSAQRKRRGPSHELTEAEASRLADAMARAALAVGLRELFPAAQLVKLEDCERPAPLPGRWSVGHAKAVTVHQPVLVFDGSGRMVAAFALMADADRVVNAINGEVRS